MTARLALALVIAPLLGLSSSASPLPPTAAPVAAQPSSVWEQVSFNTGVHYLFTTRAGPLYAQAADGLWRSTDAGLNWSPVPLPTRFSPWLFDRVGRIEIDPVDGATIYAAAADAVYRSDDAGARWRPVFTDSIESANVQLALSPANRQLVFLSVDVPGSAQRLLRSRDAGGTWEELSALPIAEGDPCPEYRTRDIVPHTTDPKRVFRVDVCTDESVGVVRLISSRDEGTTWQPAVLPQAIPRIVYLGGLQGGVEAAPRRWYLVVATPGADGAPAASRLLRSDDDGDTWTELPPVPSPFAPPSFWRGTAVTIDPARPDRVWVARSERAGEFYASQDAGQHWRLVARQSLGWVQLLTASADSRYLFLATDRGIFRARTDQ